MTTDADVLRVLQNGVKDAVAQSIVPNIPINFIGRNFNKPNDQKWLELVWIPNNQDLYYGEETLFQGIFRLVLHWPKNDAGVYSPLDTIASIAAYFQKSRPLQDDRISLQIYQKPLTGGMIPEDAENLFPASMSYRSFQP